MKKIYERQRKKKKRLLYSQYKILNNVFYLHKENNEKLKNISFIFSIIYNKLKDSNLISEIQNSKFDEN